MDESRAWIKQAIADRDCIESMLDPSNDQSYCHVLAKAQQATEKSVKALVAALREEGIVGHDIGRAHQVERLASSLVRWPGRRTGSEVQNQLFGLLDGETRGAIREIDSLVPAWPQPGERFGRNTEYPFHNRSGDWTYPAASGAFRRDEVDRFRGLAYRLTIGVARLMSVIKRAPSR